MNNIEVIENGIIDLDERKLQINESNIKVLESVKEILTLGQSELLTVKMVADYFDVGLRAITSLTHDNRKELEDNGLKTYTRKEFKELALKFLEGNSKLYYKTGRGKDVLIIPINSHEETLNITNTGATIFTKRTLLNVGMLLRDSKVAKELRKRILDIVHDSENNKGNISNIVNEIDEETKLSMDLGVAMVKGDIHEVMNLNTKIFELKNKRIKQLENVIENSVTIKDSKAKIRMCINYITPRKYNGKYGLAWNDLYRFINYKLGINVNARKGNGLARFTNDEIQQIEVISKSWLNELGYDVDFKL